MAEINDQLRGEAQHLDQIEKDMQRNQQSRGQTVQQQQENLMVLEELKLLTEDANVYKLIGPALIKQDIVEARSNVEKRLEFIRQELSRLEGQAKQLDEKRNQRHSHIARLRDQAQRQAQSVSQ